MPLPLTSIVIPAHNEGAVLARGLDALLTGAEPGELDVIVVANACHDQTAEVARGRGVVVIETATPGKVPALRVGDAECRTYPRLYLDADVVVDLHSVRAMVAALDRPGILACAPTAHYDLSGIPAGARSVHIVHERLVEHRRRLSGTGAYLLSEEGHARVFPMPDVLADDAWVQRSFSDTECCAVAEASSLVRPARTLRAIVRRRARVRLGNTQINALRPLEPGARLQPAMLSDLVRRGAVSRVEALWYITAVVAERVLGMWWRLTRRQDSWAVDASTRAAV